MEQGPDVGGHGHVCRVWPAGDGGACGDLPAVGRRPDPEANCRDCRPLPEAGRRPDAEGVDRECRRASLEAGVSTSPQLQESAAPALPIGLTAELHVWQDSKSNLQVAIEHIYMFNVVKRRPKLNGFGPPRSPYPPQGTHTHPKPSLWPDSAPCLNKPYPHMMPIEYPNVSYDVTSWLISMFVHLGLPAASAMLSITVGCL